MFILQLCAFIVEPIVWPGIFRLSLDSMWYSTGNNSSAYIMNCYTSSSNVVFVLHTLILRITIPLLLIHFVFSFMRKSSQTAQIINYEYIYEVLSPVSLAIFTILMFFSNYMKCHQVF